MRNAARAAWCSLVLIGAACGVPQKSSPVPSDLGCVTVPDLVSIPPAQQGCKAPSATVEVENGCTFPVRLVAHDLVTGPCRTGTCPQLVLVQSPAIFKDGYVLRSGEGAVYEIRPDLSATGDATGELKLIVRADNGTQRVLSTAVVADVAPQVPLHVRIEYYMHPADVLFIIDNSPRMEAWAPRIREELGLTMDAFASHWRPFRTAITTADVTASGLQGRFIASDGSPPIIDARAPDARAQMEAKFDTISWTGPSAPEPLEAMSLAFSAPLAGDMNAGFLDRFRATVVFVVTDGDDHSPQSVSEYVADFRSAGGGKKSADTWFDSEIIAAMSFGEPRCSTSPLTGRLEEAVGGTGGLMLELCDEPWWWFGRSFEIFDAGLSKNLCFDRPLDSRHPVKIWLDGSELQPTGALGQQNWIYNAINNCVEFEQHVTYEHPAVLEYEFTPFPSCD